jgi:hypothetical protein
MPLTLLGLVARPLVEMRSQQRVRGFEVATLGGDLRQLLQRNRCGLGRSNLECHSADLVKSLLHGPIIAARAR